MPHYKDGTTAEVGDLVYGIPYNTKGKPITGTLIQITEDTDSCNCIVAYVDPAVLPISDPAAMYDVSPRLPWTIIRRTDGRIKAHAEDTSNEILLLTPKYDYGAIKDFLKIPQADS